MEGFCYRYDGSFAGFLCCVRDIHQYREPPALFLSPGDDRPTLYPERFVDTDPALAQRVYRRLTQRLGAKGMLMVSEGFLTTLDHKERRLCEVIDLGLRVGPGVEKHLENDHVLQVGSAIRHLQRECELLTGFVRFSDYHGLLVSEIAPKNWVLPILRLHFCDRMAEEAFLIFDKTHRQALVHKPDPAVNGGRGLWDIVEAEDFTPPPPDQTETAYRDLWRRFYQTLAIEGRYNPKCRQTHMPKRYWDCMTEFQEDAPTPPGAERPTLAEGAAAWRKTRTPLSRGSA